MSYYVRPMTKDDITEVTEIDREAFPTQWPPAEYTFEFKNRMAHYVVACDSDAQSPSSGSKRQAGGFGSWFRRQFGRQSTSDNEINASRHRIVGFSGFWVMAGEAHITSIAVRAEYRRRGIGELLLIAVIDLAVELNAEMITLEVRASNASAQNLYTKYGFDKVGERKKYYLDRLPSGDTREDALVMTIGDIKSPTFKEYIHQLKGAHSTR